MVDVNKHSRLELRVGVVALAAEGSVGLGLLQKLIFIYLLLHNMGIGLQSSKEKKIYI